MIIESLELLNYRNYEHLDLKFAKGTNIFYGDNAQGKTNILEALYVSATTKSHRASMDKELIRFDQPEAHIRVHLRKKDVPHKIDMHLKRSKAKGAAIDGIPIHRSSELFGMLNIIFFSPEDLSLIKNGPGERRRFLDLELCQLDPIYFHNLTRYNKVLKQRNNLLKQLNFRPDLEETLEIWDSQLIKYGTEVMNRRQQFITMLNDIIAKIHQNLTGNKEQLVISYEGSCKVEEFAMQLKAKSHMDKKQCSTTIGPHRDDIKFQVNEIDIRKYGSQGQQRTAALSLKLAEIELVKQVIHDTPILLLDDVLSELDMNRKNFLLGSIKGVQTMITCTGLDEFVQSQLAINQIYYVSQGTVVQK
ncbi:MAG TPA: DNA replication/repair protein RecF [Lachnospiraceae bacterium]|jgi:DNA replication and repair protein RecF|nr:DNA replication/repair protein RecF [Lachnospiraceae bacterium]HIS60925.1 DNA replication/repair protein RecF [Candidatus Scybalomonas excrementigallinarum]